LGRRFHLTALEFHQELLEGNNGLHNVAALNSFFSNPSAFASLTTSIETAAKKNKAEGACIHHKAVRAGDAGRSGVEGKTGGGGPGQQRRAAISCAMQHPSSECRPTRPLPPLPPCRCCYVRAAVGGAMAAIESPFAVEGLQSAVAARDQTIALLHYQAKQREEEMAALRQRLGEVTAALSEGGDGSGGVARRAPAPTPAGASLAGSVPLASYVATWMHSDEGGKPITAHERRTLNALVRRYLLARGYRAAAVALAEEVLDQDLGPTCDDAELLALPGSRRGMASESKANGSGKDGGNDGPGGRFPVLTLLGMHRKRIAPLQMLAESEARSDTEIEKMKAEIAALHQQLDATAAELAESSKKVEELQQQLIHAQTMRGSAAAGATTGGAPTPGVPSTGAPVSARGAAPTPAGAAPAAPPPAPPAGTPSGQVASGAASLVLANAPALLRVVADAVPALARHVVTKQRSALVPVLAAAIAADSSADSRRSLITSLLELIRRPTHAERQVIRTQFTVLASRMGVSATENELLPEVMLLAKAAKTRERRALAALLCGALAPGVSDKRCDSLLAMLAGLADSKHAIVRVAVIDGLAQLSSTLSERWARAVRSGTVVGADTTVEQASTRQFWQALDILWTCLFADTEEDAEGEELAAAAMAEFPLDYPPALALFGTPQAVEAARAAAAAGASKGAAPAAGGTPAPPAPPPLSLPASWSVIPASLASAMTGSLVPTLITWSFRLGQLWDRLLPNLLSMLAATLQSSGGSDRVHRASSASFVGANTGTFGAGPRAAAAVRLSDWHQRRVSLILAAITGAGPRILASVLEEGYTIRPVADAPLASGVVGADGAPIPVPPADILYDLFDCSTKDATAKFPSEASLTPEQRSKRQMFLLQGLVRGTAGTRRKRRGADADPWQPVRDIAIAVEWPSLRFVVRTLFATLLRQAACVNRASKVGVSIINQYADALSALSAAFGPVFTSYVVRPMFMRAFGLPCELPPPGTAGVPGGVYDGRPPALVLFAQVLLGMPSTAADARRAAAAAPAVTAQQLAVMMAAAPGSGSDVGPGAAAALVNFASAGVRGSDWPLLLAELAWLHRDSTDNPSNWSRAGGRAPSSAAAGGADVMTGGWWNAEHLLPLFASGVLACPELKPRELLDQALDGLIGAIGGAKAGWGPQQQPLLEDAVVRIGGGATGVRTGAAPGAQRGAVTSRPAAAAANGAHAAAGSSAAPASADTPLDIMLSRVFPRAAARDEPAIRACIAGLYRSLIPLMSSRQLHTQFLPEVRKLAHDTNRAVVMAGVRTLAFVYSSSAATDVEVQKGANDELTALLQAGPKNVIVEILRATMRILGDAPPALREGFILTRLVELNHDIVSAAKAGAKAMRDFCDQMGVIDAGDVHSAAAVAAQRARAAAMQGAEPWPGALPEEFEDVAMALCENFKAMGSLSISRESKAVVRGALIDMLETDLLEPNYHHLLENAVTALFPPEADPDPAFAGDDAYGVMVPPPTSTTATAAAATGIAGDRVAPGAGFGGEPTGAFGLGIAEPDTIGAGFIPAGPDGAHNDTMMSALSGAFKQTARVFNFGLGGNDHGGRGGGGGGGPHAGGGPAGTAAGGPGASAVGFFSPSGSAAGVRPPAPPPAGGAHPPVHPPAPGPRAPTPEAPTLSMAAFAAAPPPPGGGGGGVGMGARRNSGTRGPPGAGGGGGVGLAVGGGAAEPPAVDMSSFMGSGGGGGGADGRHPPSAGATGGGGGGGGGTGGWRQMLGMGAGGRRG